MHERFAESAEVWVVTPQTKRPSELPDTIAVLLDPDSELEKAYHAAGYPTVVVKLEI